MQSIREHHRCICQRYLCGFAFDYVYAPGFSTDLANTTTMDVHGRAVTSKLDTFNGYDRIEQSNVYIVFAPGNILGYHIFQQLKYITYVCHCQRSQCELDRGRSLNRRR